MRRHAADGPWQGYLQFLQDVDGVERYGVDDWWTSGSVESGALDAWFDACDRLLSIFQTYTEPDHCIARPLLALLHRDA